MNLGEVVKALSLEARTADVDLEREVTGCYISDLLSDVMANAQEGEVWITLQTHPNTVAVAVLRNLAAIILTNKRNPEGETLTKADEERIPIFVTSHSTFEAGGKLYQFLRC
ncbi:MAG TPA: DRTGG domain-containing protein [Thermodesulfovibrionales bacterium]|jgi:predicted transcriptional regulator|nr:DRTGG domain-containing protein [Thermodesulfovibrionales bacterium]